MTDATGAEFHFCSPRHPWEKGAVENTNGLIRKYFPKGTDFSLVADERIGGCTMESTADRVSAWAGGPPGGPLLKGTTLALKIQEKKR